jgi:hypothetical protein
MTTLSAVTYSSGRPVERAIEVGNSTEHVHVGDAGEARSTNIHTYRRSCSA